MGRPHTRSHAPGGDRLRGDRAYELSAFRLTTTATPVYIQNRQVSASVLSVQRPTLPNTRCGQGHVLGLRFGTLPPAGNRARVFVSAGDLPQVVGSEGFVDLAFDGSAWSVAPVPDPLESFLGGCG